MGDIFDQLAANKGDIFDQLATPSAPVAPNAGLAPGSLAPATPQMDTTNPVGNWFRDLALKSGDYLKNAAVGMITPMPVAMAMDTYHEATAPPQPAPTSVRDFFEQLGTRVGGKFGVDAKSVAEDASNKRYGALFNDAAVPMAGAIAGGRFGSKMMQRPAGMTTSVMPSGSVLAGALGDVGAVPTGVDAVEQMQTATPGLLEAAKQTGAPTNVVEAQAVARQNIGNIESAVDKLHDAANPQSPVANYTQPAIDALTSEATANAQHSPAKAAAYQSEAQRLRDVSTGSDLRQLKKNLNVETDAAQSKTSMTDNPHSTQAKLDALNHVRKAQYDWLADQTGADPNAVRALAQRESSAIAARDYFDRAQPRLAMAEAVDNAPQGFLRSAGSVVRHVVAGPKRFAINAATGETLPANANSVFNLRLKRAFGDLSNAPDVQYPQANGQMALRNNIGLNQAQTAVPSGPSTPTPLDEYRRLNPPPYQTPDMGQAAAAWASDPAYPVPANGQPQFLPRRGNLNLQDANPPHWPQRVQPQAAPTMSPIPAAGAEVPRVAPGGATYYQEPQVPIEWLESQSQPAYPVLRDVMNKAKNGIGSGRTGQMEDVSPANWPYQQTSPQPLAWWQEGQGGGTPRNRPAPQTTDAADLAGWLRRTRR